MYKKKIRQSMIEGNFLEKCYQKIKAIIIFLTLNNLNGKNRKRLFRYFDTLIAKRSRRYIAKKTEVDQNKILFMTTRGSYNCNPKAIADEIIRQKLPWKLVWVARKENIKRLEQYPKNLQIVIRGSYEFYQEAASAKILIDNSVSLSYLDVWKKPNQILIETWHGSLGLKRFETTSDKKWIRKAIDCGKRTNYCISNSDFEDELFRQSFWSSCEILKYGHARNDILLTEDIGKKSETIKKVHSFFKIDKEVRIALYAPTFRDETDLFPYMIDYELLHNALEKKFGGNWLILTRLHFTIRKQIAKIKSRFPSYVVDATSYEDIQDLLLVAEIGITDYSSWICDFVLTRRPAFIFAVDLRNYNQERGFYYPIQSTPFPIAQSNNELTENILNFDNELYQKNCEDFIISKGCIDDGHAAERIVEKIKEIIGGTE